MAGLRFLALLALPLKALPPEKLSGLRRLADTCSTGDSNSRDDVLSNKGFVCQRVVKEGDAAIFTIHYGYDAEKDLVKLACISEKSGFFAFGPAESATSGAVLVASNGDRNDQAWSLAATAANMKKRIDLAWLDHATTDHNGKRRVQFTMPSSQMSGSLENANFAYLYHESDQNFEDTTVFKSGVVAFKVGAKETQTTISHCQSSSFQNAADRGLTCMQPIPTTDKLDLHWGVDDEAKTISFGIVHRGEGWVGFGVGTSMSDSTALIMADDASGGEIFKLKHHVKPDINTDKTTELKAEKIRLTKSAGARSATFTIPQSQLVGSTEKASFIWAFGTSGALTEHDSRGSFDINLKSGGKAMSTKLKTPDLIWAHIVLMAWAIFGVIPMAVFIAIFAGPRFRLGPKWFHGHWTTMLFGLALMTTALTLALLASPFDTDHGIVGCVAFGCMGLQPLIGFFRVDLSHPKRPVWEFVHKGLGRVALVLMLATSVLGGEEFRTTYKSSSLLILTAVFSGIIVLCWFALMLFQILGKHSDLQPQALNNAKASRASGNASTLLGKLHRQQDPEDQIASLAVAQTQGASPRAAPLMLTPKQPTIQFTSPMSARSIPDEHTQAQGIAEQNIRAHADAHGRGSVDSGIASDSQPKYMASVLEGNEPMPKIPSHRRKKGKLRKIQ